MNLPNKLTMLRMVLAPVFLYFLLAPQIPYNSLIALVVFAAAAITDFFDGNIARKYKLITNFGKLMDPIADKLLVTCALLGLVQLGFVPVWVAVLILTREFLVTSLRTMAVETGQAIEVSIWGKTKTMVQMIWISYVLVLLALPSFYNLPAELVRVLLMGSWVLMLAVVGLTVYSGLQYLLRNTHLFKDMR